MIWFRARTTLSAGSEKSFSLPVGHEVHGPHLVRGLWHSQFLRLVPLQTIARLDPEVQLQFAVNLVDTLVVPAMTLDISHILEA